MKDDIGSPINGSLVHTISPINEVTGLHSYLFKYLGSSILNSSSISSDKILALFA